MFPDGPQNQGKRPVAAPGKPGPCRPVSSRLAGARSRRHSQVSCIPGTVTKPARFRHFRPRRAMLGPSCSLPRDRYLPPGPGGRAAGRMVARLAPRCPPRLPRRSIQPYWPPQCSPASRRTGPPPCGRKARDCWRSACQSCHGLPSPAPQPVVGSSTRCRPARRGPDGLCPAFWPKLFHRSQSCPQAARTGRAAGRAGTIQGTSSPVNTVIFRHGLTAVSGDNVCICTSTYQPDTERNRGAHETSSHDG